MDSLPAGPYPYCDSLVRSLATVETEDQGVHYRTKFGFFGSIFDEDWKKVEECIENVEYFNLLDGKTALEGMITRVEVFREYGDGRPQGLVAFNDACVALFHVSCALLGYEGSGPKLTQRVLAAIGIPVEMFERVNQQVHPGSYMVIFSREKTELLEGVKVSKYEGCKDEWEYWFDRPLV